MNLSNILQHPKTSIAGILLATVTVAGVLSQQGITLGKAGTGTWVSLIGAVGGALLGLLARDPGASSGSEAGSTNKVGAIMLCSLALMGSLPVADCNGSAVAQDIVNWTPALEDAVATAAAVCPTIYPPAAPACMTAGASFKVFGDTAIAEAKAYLANPNASTLQHLQTALVTLQQSVNQNLLQAARIVDPASQQRVLVLVNAVGTIAEAMLALVLSITAKTSAAKMAATAQVKISMVQPLMLRDRASQIQLVAMHYDVSPARALAMTLSAEANLQAAGF